MTADDAPRRDRSRDDEDARRLVERCLRGDAGAWEAFVDRYADLVWSVARGYRLPTADCEDVVQAVFVAAVKGLDRVRDAARVSAWLITTAHRECWRVGRARDRSIDVDGDFASVDEPTDERLEQLERRDRVRSALARIGARCRDLLEALFLASGKPDYERVAARLGMPVGSIGPTRARCLDRLRAQLERRGAGPGDRG